MHDLTVDGLDYPVRRARPGDVDRSGKQFPRCALVAFDPLGQIVAHARTRAELVVRLRHPARG